MSLITGREWEAAVGRHLSSLDLPGIVCERSGAPSERAGGRLREVSAGPADFQARGAGWRVAIEVKKSDGRFPFAKLAESQAADLDSADHGIVLLRVAGDGAHAPDLVYLLDWADLGPLWWTWRLAEDLPEHGRHAPGSASLSEREAADMARETFGVDGVTCVMDDHGVWRCPRSLERALERWGLHPAPDGL